MTKEQIIEKLKSIGIVTDNVFPKKTFLSGGIPVVACYKRELREDFYFFNSYDNAIFKIFQTLEPEDKFERDSQTDRYLIPDLEWELVWKDEPFVEMPDLSYRDMTLRQFAAITLKVPESGVPWLDELIKKA